MLAKQLPRFQITHITIVFGAILLKNFGSENTHLCERCPLSVTIWFTPGGGGGAGKSVASLLVKSLLPFPRLDEKLYHQHFWDRF